MVCPITPVDRRRVFWTTKPAACGFDVECFTRECGSPGLVLQANGVIENDNYITSLLLNMLMTNGRQPNTECGYTPGSLGGHWSESFIEGEGTIGTLVRSIEPQGDTNTTSNIIKAFVDATLARLVTRGVVNRFDSSVVYSGSGRFAVEITVYGIRNDTTKVGLSTQRLSEGWAWETQQ